MKNITLKFVYDKNKRATASNPQPLYVEVRLRGTSKQTYINTGIKLYPNQFSKSNGFTCKNHKRAPLITREARDIFNQIEEFAFSDGCTSLREVKHFNKAKTYNMNVLDFMEKELRESNPTDSVLEHHRVLINQISRYGNIHTFEDLTFKNIDGFDKFLRNSINSQPVLYKRHNAFKRYINKAIKLGLCEKNPYDDFKVEKGKDLKEPVFLTEEELQKIKDLSLVDEKLENVRRLFLFQCYTGMAYVDLQNFSEEWISESEGYKVIRSHRAKTNESFVTILFPEAEEVLGHFDYKLPVISNQKYNDYLKLLQAGAGIKKSITTHVARHTFATTLINKDVPIESVSKALGHSNIKQTTHYARLLGKKVVSDLAKLINQP